MWPLDLLPNFRWDGVLTHSIRDEILQVRFGVISRHAPANSEYVTVQTHEAF